MTLCSCGSGNEDADNKVPAVWTVYEKRIYYLSEHCELEFMLPICPSSIWLSHLESSLCRLQACS